MYDLIIKNGKIVDGTGNPWFYADIGIKDEKIAAIGNLSSTEAKRVLDASDHVVSPGFIDVHAHGADQLLSFPTADAKIRQGVTTMLDGNCGISVAPLNEFGKPIMQSHGIESDCATLDEFFTQLETIGTAINVASLVGNGTVRACVVGVSDKKPTEAQMQQMKSLVDEAMAHGAMGLSTGLVYPLSGYADKQEIIKLCEVAAKHGGFYASHVRTMGHLLFEAVAEGLDIGRQAGLPVQISHLLAGPPQWGRLPELMGLLERARSEGMDVTTDNVVYRYSGFEGGSLLPLWATEGGMEKLIQRINNSETREKIKADTREIGDRKGGSVAACLMEKGEWDNIWLYLPERLRGKTIADLAAETGVTDPYDVLLDLIVQEKGAIQGRTEPMSQVDIDYTTHHPLCMLISDGWPSKRGGFTVMHTFGSFGKVFGEYVRDRGVVRLEEAVRKCTSFPAQRMGLRDRGQIKEGYFADITIFNPDTVKEKGTFDNPEQHPDGFTWVLVNGKVVLDNGEHTGVLPGKALRRNLLTLG
ncbi:MAG: D-aminoacylase [Deltaproteobacteria bacterium]|nr:D-aminoacylase [Deltaproteobacteria bacterium]